MEDTYRIEVRLVIDEDRADKYGIAFDNHISWYTTEQERSQVIREKNLIINLK